jgi:hypothetical protein
MPEANMTNGTNNNAAAKTRSPKGPMTAIEAITKIGKILEQLSPADRKRVIDFVNVPLPSAE